MRLQEFDWADYLSFAQALDPLAGEATIRAAVSRAYYAAYGNAWRKSDMEIALRDAGTLLRDIEDILRRGV